LPPGGIQFQQNNSEIKITTMKKSIILAAFAVLIGVFSAQAQGGNGGGGGFQRRTVEERVKSVMEKLGDLKLDKDQTTRTDSAFSEFYRAQDKAMQEMRAAGQPDREKMRETRQKLEADRDEKLKKIFTEAQFKKWKDEIEATTRPQRGGGGGNRNGGGGNN
jgi:protein CpxP